jgi:hypothetical protein
MLDSGGFTELILVEPEITKAEFISFLIGYFRHCEPTLQTILYLHEHNALKIEYVNKLNKIKTVLIRFAPGYVVKDEELSMVVEKGKLKYTTLSLQRMRITDGFMMFLANCDKMLHISRLDISHCPLISESGKPQPI